MGCGCGGLMRDCFCNEDDYAAVTVPKMQVRFRVMATVTHRGQQIQRMLFTSSDYDNAEAFCQAFEGEVHHLEIKKVWAPR